MTIKKWTLVFVSFGLVLTCLMLPITVKAGSDDIVYVEVVVGTLTEDDAKNIVLDDGSTLGNHKFELIDSSGDISINAVDALGYYFLYAAWITRDGEVSLSVQPQDRVKASETVKNSAWQALNNPNTGFGVILGFIIIPERSMRSSLIISGSLIGKRIGI